MRGVESTLRELRKKQKRLAKAYDENEILDYLSDGEFRDLELSLSKRQGLMMYEYFESGRPTEAYLKAGYQDRGPVKNKENAGRLLQTWKLKQFHKELVRRTVERTGMRVVERKIATANEVLEFFTNVMNGDVKEKKTLWNGTEHYEEEVEPSMSDRISAGKVLANYYQLNGGDARLVIDGQLTEDVKKIANNGNAMKQINSMMSRLEKNFEDNVMIEAKFEEVEDGA